MSESMPSTSENQAVSNKPAEVTLQATPQTASEVIITATKDWSEILTFFVGRHEIVVSLLPTQSLRKSIVHRALEAGIDPDKLITRIDAVMHDVSPVYTDRLWRQFISWLLPSHQLYYVSARFDRWAKRRRDGTHGIVGNMLEVARRLKAKHRNDQS